jgi:D-alanyl-D-alanine carboxypeptidase
MRHDVGVQPRRWGVGLRRAAAAGVAAVLVANMLGACARPGLSSPPEPEFTHGRPPVTTLPAPSTLSPVTAEQPELEAIEPDITTPDSTLAPPSTGVVEEMLIVDDAGNIAPNASGWKLFDDALEARLIPSDVSASVAVMIDGSLVHQAAFGTRVAGSGEAVDVTDRFRIASISKVITSIVVMRLVEQGVLSLDQPVGQLLADHLLLPAYTPEAGRITVRQLLSHTSGFPKHQNTFFGGGAVSYADAVAVGLTASIAGPGRYVYSNMNFAALSVLIEAVTGATYETVVAQQLLDPLGITGMRMTGTYDLGPDEVSHHPAAGRNYMEALGGAGAWNATPSDLVAIVNSIDPLTPGWKALSPESLAVMRYTVADGLPPHGYGLGLINYPGDAWGHTGTIEHAHSMVLVQPEGVTWALTVSGETPSNSEALRNIVGAAMASAFPPGGRTG